MYVTRVLHLAQQVPRNGDFTWSPKPNAVGSSPTAPVDIKVARIQCLKGFSGFFVWFNPN